MGHLRSFVFFGAAASGAISQLEVHTPPQIVIAPHIASETVLYAPDVEPTDATDQTITAPHIANGSVLYAPVLTAVGAGGDDEDDDMTPRRFWRLEMVKQASNGFALDTLEFRTVIGGTQAATGGTPVESGHFGSEVPANAFDGSTSKWAGGSTSGYEYLGYDFGSGNEVDIVEVAIKSYTSEQAQTPFFFRVQKGDDGINWKDAWVVQTTPDWAAAETRVFTKPA